MTVPPPTVPPLLYRRDDFLSDSLGVPCHAISVLPGSSTDDVRQALRLISGGPGFDSAKVPVDRVGEIGVLTGDGFVVVDTNVQLRAEGIDPMPSAVTVRVAEPRDAAPVTAIARGAFSLTRFHLDPQIDDGVADDLKARWAGNYFAGLRGDEMLVAESGTDLMGFLQILTAESHTTIDLVAVDSDHRGGGVGAALVRATAALAPDRPVQVGTQLANISALRFYEGLGFRVIGATHVLHRHRAPIAC